MINIETDSDRILIYILGMIKAFKKAGVDEKELAILTSAVIYGKIRQMEDYDKKNGTLAGIMVSCVPCHKYLSVIPRDAAKIEVIKCRELMKSIYGE
jgi:hypothetical protein